jgi:hypothetical protein
MWIASKYGFFSVVLKDGHHHIRARMESDLKALILHHPRAGEFSVEEWPSADYRYRIRIPEQDPAFGEFMRILASSVDYPNFKNQISANPDQRHKLDAYHRIWGILADLQK